MTEFRRIKGVTEWVNNGSECFILTQCHLFSWIANPRQSDPTETICPARGTSWDTNGTWERKVKLVQHGDMWMEFQICVIDNSESPEVGAVILVEELRINCQKELILFVYSEITWNTLYTVLHYYNLLAYKRNLTQVSVAHDIKQRYGFYIFI